VARHEVVFIGGRSGVGKSAVAAELFRQLAAADVMHCLIDGDNLDLAHPSPFGQGHDLAEQNLRAMWQNYQAIGHSRLIYTNTASVLPGSLGSLTAALGGTPRVHAVLLSASDPVADRRLALREAGGGLHEHRQRSRSTATVLEHAAPDWVHRLVTDDLDVATVAAQIAALLDWK
jgi:gluconate kinase